ncbi:MAG: hypothetical protein AAB402_04965 [Patescibacteria group bacterium]
MDMRLLRKKIFILAIGIFVVTLLLAYGVSVATLCGFGIPESFACLTRESGSIFFTPLVTVFSGSGLATEWFIAVGLLITTLIAIGWVQRRSGRWFPIGAIVFCVVAGLVVAGPVLGLPFGLLLYVMTKLANGDPRSPLEIFRRQPLIFRYAVWFFLTKVAVIVSVSSLFWGGGM